MGKKRKKAWKVAPLCFFWLVWKERKIIAFESEEFSVHRLKHSFVCNFWSWTKSIIDEGPLPLINFFDWLVLDEGWCAFLFPIFFFVFTHRCLLYTPYMLWVGLLAPFLLFNIYFFLCLPIKKKRKSLQFF